MKTLNAISYINIKHAPVTIPADTEVRNIKRDGRNSSLVRFEALLDGVWTHTAARATTLSSVLPEGAVPAKDAVVHAANTLGSRIVSGR